MRHLAILPLVGLLMGIMPGPALADSAPVIVPFQNVLVIVNPCTNEPVTVTATGYFRVHFFHNDQVDTHHDNQVALYNLETSDGFTGRGVFHRAHTGDGELRLIVDEEDGMLSQFDVGTVRSPHTREVIVFKLGAHLTYRSGEFIVSMEWTTLECRGRPG